MNSPSTLQKYIHEHIIQPLGKMWSESPVLMGMLSIIVALMIFWAGMAVGYHKAIFSYTWHSEYAEQFAGKHSLFTIPTDHDADSMPNPHGAFGTIVSVDLPLIVVKGPTEAEKSIDITTNTIVRDIHDQAASTSLENGQSVIVMGWPDQQGHIVASFIRILPSDTSTNTMSSSSPTNP